VIESHGTEGLKHVTAVTEGLAADSQRTTTMPFAAVAEARRRLDMALTVGFSQQIGRERD
jgi:hypothetical protein